MAWSNDPQLQQLAEILTRTISPDPNVRRPAENALCSRESELGFPVILLKLVDSGSADLTVRATAAIAFKNIIKKRWAQEEGEPSLLHDSDRATVKEFVVDLMLRSPEIVLKQLSEAVSIIGKHDFPKKWPELVPYMTTKFQSGDFHVINGVLRTASSLFQKYKHEFASNELFTEIKYVLENFAQPFTSLFVATIDLTVQKSADIQSLNVLVSSLVLMAEIFYCLNYQDLPEFFEDNMNIWMSKFLELLQFQNEALQKQETDGPGLLEKLRTQICENVCLYATKYREEFEPYLAKFVASIWHLLTSIGLHWKYDLLVSQAIDFLASVAKQSHNKGLFEDPNTLGSICENVILPNMKFRESDLEIYEDSPEEYIQRDIDGSDSATRRRSACDLVKSLAIHFEEKITHVFSGYIKALLDAYSTNPAELWPQKDTAIYLVTSLAVKAQTAKFGATQVNQLVNINSFYRDHILPELQSPNVDSIPVIKSDALRYVLVFRSLLEPDLIKGTLLLLPKLMAAKSVVTRSYASNLVDKTLLLRGQDGLGLVRPEELLPQADTLLKALFDVLNMTGSRENEFAMKAILRCLVSLGDKCIPVLAHLLPVLTVKVAEVSQNPSQPHFNHALFESLGFSIRLVCRTTPQAIGTFEDVLFPTFQQILSQDVQDFVPYVFQVLSLLIEFRSMHSLPLPDPYKVLFPILLTPVLWDRPGFVPPLVRLISAFICIQRDTLLAEDSSRENTLLGILQRLIQSKARDQEGFALLTAMFQSFSDSFWAVHEQKILLVLFQRLSSNRTPKYSKALILFFCRLVLARGPKHFMDTVEKIQAKMFGMVLRNLFTQDIGKMGTLREEKLAIVGSTQLLEFVLSVPEYTECWAPLLDATLTLFEKVGPGAGAEGDTAPSEQFVELESSEGYQAAYSKLQFAKQEDVEDVKLQSIKDPRAKASNMSLTCALSNEVPEEPVVSPVSGAIFEKRLAVKYISENGVDPINSQPISVDQLIDVKTPPVVKPRPPSITSIPAILKALQDEWDAVMLHSFQLRQQLQTARQELSHALYQHDAACRVIARQNKELTAAREALATLKPQANIPSAVAEAGGPAAIPAQAGMEAAPQVQEVESGPLSQEVITKLLEKATVLTQERKKRGKSVPEDLMSQDAIRGFKTLASHPGLHSAGAPGILCLDIHAADTSRVVTGGQDKNATVFNKETEQVIAILKGHTKKVSRVVYHPTEDVVVTCSPDTHIRIWDVGTSQTMHLITAHSGPVTGLSLHATGDYILSTSLDQHWAFSDIRTGRVLTQVTDQSNPVALTAAQFHPDGLIFATGTSDAQIKIWDLKERANVANFPEKRFPVP
ncbi:unnamed protein product [Cyprideis torosa]|uniref:Pre-mRNA-processing factor 19 n=1 Tax=Cyprideis torosa TaxID=163714 RepID=A0A7R8WP31_9CRUS|nr:unnamed protein product [Cyprideis torosa]CAG0901076.1 unnamed protein product [Cyprideis torosa]